MISDGPMMNCDQRTASGFRYVAPGAVSIGRIPAPSSVISDPTRLQEFRSTPLPESLLPIPETSLQDVNGPRLSTRFSTVHHVVETAHDNSGMEAITFMSRHLTPAATAGRPSCSSNLDISPEEAHSGFSLDQSSSRLASGILSSQTLKTKARAWASLASSKQSGLEIPSDDGSLEQSDLRSERLANTFACHPFDSAMPSCNPLSAPRTPTPSALHSCAHTRALTHLAPEILAASPKGFAVISSSDERLDQTSSGRLPRTTNLIVIPSRRRMTSLESSSGCGQSETVVQPSASLAAELQSRTVERVVSASLSITSSSSPSATESHNRTSPARVERLDPRLSPRVRPEARIIPKGHQAHEIVPHETACCHVMSHSDVVVRSPTLPNTVFDRQTRLSLTDTSLLAPPAPSILCKTPPPPHVRTSTEVYGDSNKLSPCLSECSSPLTSLVSEDDSSDEELDNGSNGTQSRRSKPTSHQWTKALWRSFTEAKLEQAPEYPVIGQQFESLEACKQACLFASWARGHHMNIRRSQKSSSTLKRVLCCAKGRTPPRGCNCTFRIVVTFDQSLEDPAWIVTHVCLKHHNHNPKPGDIEETKRNSRLNQSQASRSSGRRRTFKRLTTMSEQPDAIVPDETAPSDVIPNSDHDHNPKPGETKETKHNSRHKHSRVSHLSIGRRTSKRSTPMGEQSDETVPDETAPRDVLPHSVSTSSMHAKAGSDRISRLSPSNRSPLAVVAPLMPPKTPPQLQLTTNMQSLADSNKPSSWPLNWSSPLTSLASDDDTCEERDQATDDKHSRRFKPMGHQWIKALWESFADSKLEQAPEYPALGQEFESLEAYKQACLLASWARGHHMHIRNSQKSGSTLKHVLSCSKDRAPPRGCNCTFRIAATLDQSLRNSNWIITHVFLQHHNHIPKPGGIENMTRDAAQQQSQVTSLFRPRRSGKSSISKSNQADETLPDLPAPSDVLANGDPVITSQMLPQASQGRSGLFIANESPSATDHPSIHCKTPPPLQSKKRQVSGDSNDVLSWPLEWSSPLTSLASEDDTSEELGKVNQIQSRRSKPNGHQWTKALWQSFTDTVLEQAPEYPAIGQEFKSLEAYKEACLLASWAHGHHMHIRSSQKSSSIHKHVLSCSKDRAPPKGCNCTFRIAATFDRSLENPTWIVSHVYLQHHNHTPQPGEIEEAKGTSSSKPSQAGCNSGRMHTATHSVTTLRSRPSEKKEDKDKSRRYLGKKGPHYPPQSKKHAQSAPCSTEKSLDSLRVAENTPRTRNNTSKASEMSNMMSSVGLRSSKRKCDGSDDTNSSKRSITRKFGK